MTEHHEPTPRAVLGCGFIFLVGSMLVNCLGFLYGMSVAGQLITSSSNLAVFVGICLYFIVFVFCPGLALTLVWATHKTLKEWSRPS